MALFEKKVVIVTGAGSGIGRATSIKLSRMGAKLSLCDVNERALIETCNLCDKERTLHQAFDIGHSDAVEVFVRNTMTSYHQIDHVFNCAGINPTYLPTTLITDRYWDKIMDTNVKGVFIMTRACTPHMKSGGTFTNMSSILGQQGGAGYAAYCASKYAVIGFSKSMALELGPRGMRTNVVAPGYIDTPTNAVVVEGKEAVEKTARSVAMGRFGTVDEVADVVIFLMSEGGRYMNGSVVEVNGGMQ